MEVLVIDGQGGRIGQQLIRCIRERFPETAVIAVGTNSIATAAMLRAGAPSRRLPGRTPWRWPAAGPM